MNRSDVEEFVAAADALVNMLATEPQEGEAPIYEERTHAAYNRYDAARCKLMGDPADDEE